MQCPRLKHFARLNHNGTIGRCGHMTNPPDFNTFEEMENSDWLQQTKEKMKNNVWPNECIRCKMTEETSNTSIRLDMIKRHKLLYPMNKNYLIVGGVLDNICNSACQTCHSGLSTKIGSLESKDYEKINNYEKFFTFPQDRILELDINGGEPTASPNYKKLLKNLPSSVEIIRINTNGSKILPELESLLKEKVKVIITISFDGTKNIHDYVRWPIRWKEFEKNVEKYLNYRNEYSSLRLNFWTTISCLNVADLENILNYAKEKNIDHGYGFCIRPSTLDIRHSNFLTQKAKKVLSKSNNKLIKLILKKSCTTEQDNNTELKVFLEKQDNLRKINYLDYSI